MDWLNTLIPTDPDAQQALNIALHGLHTGMIGFVLTGWMWRRLLGAHRLTLLVIWISWLGLGWWVGHLGYCILTDYHWRLLEAMGVRGLPSSYIEYLLRFVWRDDIPDQPLSAVTGIVFAIVTLCSVVRRKKGFSF